MRTTNKGKHIHNSIFQKKMPTGHIGEDFEF